MTENEDDPWHVPTDAELRGWIETGPASGMARIARPLLAERALVRALLSSWGGGEVDFYDAMKALESRSKSW